MINKIFKIIHNKYLSFFRFLFFLRYLFVIFFVSLVLFLLIPSFFNNETQLKTIKNHLIKKYNFEINKYEKIEYNAFPVPNLELTKTQINLENSSINFKVASFKIYPKILSIYNYKNFQSNKIVLTDCDAVLDIKSLKMFIKNFLNQKNRLYLNTLDLKILEKDKEIIILEDIKLANYGYLENKITGKIFSKKFRVNLDKEFKNINFKLPDAGIKTEINFTNHQKFNFRRGNVQSKITNNNVKFKFDYNNKVLRIYDTFFRSQNLSFNNESFITTSPFLDINSKFNIEELDSEIVKNINIEKLLSSKEIIKKLNIKNEINFVAKKFTNNLIDKLNLKMNLAYGRMNFEKKFEISKSFFECKGNVNFLEEYPLLFFNCTISADNKKKFLKKFSIKSKQKNEILNIYVKGNLNILNNKVNFKTITMNNNFNVSKEDLKYINKSFENIFFNRAFIEIFDLKKIKEFILEVS